MEIKKVHDEQFKELEGSFLNYYDSFENEVEKNKENKNSELISNLLVAEAIETKKEEEEETKNNEKVYGISILEKILATVLVLIVLFGCFLGLIKMIEEDEKEFKEKQSQMIEEKNKNEYDLSLKLNSVQNLSDIDKNTVKVLDYVLNDTLINLAQEWKFNPSSKFIANLNVPSYINNQDKKVELSLKNSEFCKIIGERYFSSTKNINNYYNLEINNKTIKNSQMVEPLCDVSNSFIYEWNGKSN